MVIPYALFSPSELFPISRTVDLYDHFLFVSAIGIFSAAIFTIGRATANLIQNKLFCFRYDCTPIHFRLYSSILWVSIFAHLLAIAMAGPGFLTGGFIEARDSGLISGIGIPMRLYLLVIPWIISSNSLRKLRRELTLLFILILLRSIIFSERLAIFEFLIGVWFYYYITKTQPKFVNFVKVIGIALVGFSLLQAARMATISGVDEKMIGIADVGPIDTILAYYGDVQNKAYKIFFDNFRYAETSYDAIIRKTNDLGFSEPGAQDRFFFNGLFENRNFVSSLNNPGGLAQDINDFDGYLGIVILGLKIYAFSFFIYSARRTPTFQPLAILSVISVLEYPRFNYLYLPYGVALVWCATTIIILHWYLSKNSAKRSKK